ncbi:uncharacterized protein LOC115735048 isoform X2 [Rhodamnia argentea]|uniref:Uncharacterized protein LOC115735048 isoform X2 n=1 Tax=Rhodamnia argentea TaxID=178133 RepID=A0ABM3HZK8_9MYRT|nr:uncharacterized protein LOC115735048 isoform X2 [Rhodamnia argentea]
MKDESAFEEGETQFCARFGQASRGSDQSEAGAQRGRCNGGSEVHSGGSKRLNGSSSLIVYARRVKPRNGFTVHAEISGMEIFEGLREMDVANDVTEEQPSDGTSDFSTSEVEVETDRTCFFDEEPDRGLVEIVVQEGVSSTVRGRQSREETKIVEELDGLVDVVIREDGCRHETSLVHKIEEGQTLVSVSHAVEYEATSKMEGDANGETADLTTRNNLESKMSKLWNGELVTVSDLFDTGLLDGRTVVYVGGSNMVSGLRGVIKDGGILCSCAKCNGCRVIPPSQFEIHACGAYKRASQYTCLENGKSLLDVLRACREAPLHLLESTVESIIHHPPVEKSFTCRGCKGMFPAFSVARAGSLCNACVQSKKSQSTPNNKSRNRARPSNKLLMSKSADDALATISSPKRTQWKTSRKSPRADLLLTASRSACALISPQMKSQLKMKSPKLVSKVRYVKSSSAPISSQKKSQWKITIKDQRLHKLVFEEDGLPDGTEVAYYSRGQKLLEGYKKGFGIFCRCCNCEVSPSQFEVHAGWASRKKPYSNIYTSNGVSLHELAISLSKGRKYSARDNDNLCIICADVGNLLLCDGCPRAFHKECASLTNIPRGKWYCNYCENIQKEKFVNVNAVAAGRVSGVDPIEQITKRCIRIVKNIGSEVTGCALCRGYDFSKSGFGPRTIILCDQCEKEYHVGCLRDHRMASLKELPKGKWFCCTDCSRIHSTLQDLLVRGEEKLQDSLLNILKKKHEEKGLGTVNNYDARWRLLSGSFACSESRRLLSEAVSIFHECFDPIVDPTTNRDLIPSMVYGRSTRNQEYGGMYCAVLIVNSIVVSAGILRIFGQEIAELPLVATKKGSHDQGYFQLLFSCIQKLLGFLNVRSLVLPAAAEAESIWTDKFGFVKMELDQLTSYRKICSQMVTFKGTPMLQKPVPRCSIDNPGIC